MLPVPSAPVGRVKAYCRAIDAPGASGPTAFGSVRTSAVASVSPVVVFVMTTWSSQATVAGMLPAFVSSQVTVRLDPWFSPVEGETARLPTWMFSTSLGRLVSETGAAVRPP